MNTTNEHELAEVLTPFLLQKARETEHSRQRKLNRRISSLMIEIIQVFGKPLPGHGDTQYLELPREFIEEATKAMQIRVVIKDGREVTCERKTTSTKKRMKSENRPMSSKPDKHKMAA